MTLLAIFFTVAVFVPVAVNLYAVRVDKHMHDALCMSFVVLTIWGLTRFMHMTLGEPEGKAMNPLLDVLGGMFALRSWLEFHKGWKVLLMGLFLAQCILAVPYWYGHETGGVVLPYLDYVRLNNILWLAQIVCISWPGVGQGRI